MTLVILVSFMTLMILITDAIGTGKKNEDQGVHLSGSDIMQEERISIDTEYIKLGQLLKLASLVSQGSDAKLLIQNGEVSLNGQTVYERGKKVRPGDRVTVNGLGSIVVEDE